MKIDRNMYIPYILSICLILGSSIAFAWYTSLYWYSVKVSWYTFMMRATFYYVAIQLAIVGLIYLGGGV